jgi:5'-nucleotidase
VEIAQDMSRKLKQEDKCDLVICLSHLGFAYEDRENRHSDSTLAEATEHIDLIIGGHTHTFLDRPIIMRNRKDERVLVNQVGCYGINLGRIDFLFDDMKNVASRGISISV